MTKNYFTDEQVKEIYYSEAGDSIEIGAFEFYKGLFNKAVEAAIGEAVAKVIRPLGEQMYVDITNYAPINDGDLLYSVKELEN